MLVDRQHAAELGDGEGALLEPLVLLEQLIDADRVNAVQLDGVLQGDRGELVLQVQQVRLQLRIEAQLDGALAPVILRR